jgi:hypothetical protein
MRSLTGQSKPAARNGHENCAVQTCYSSVRAGSVFGLRYFAAAALTNLVFRAAHGVSATGLALRARSVPTANRGVAANEGLRTRLTALLGASKGSVAATLITRTAGESLSVCTCAALFVRSAGEVAATGITGTASELLSVCACATSLVRSAGGVAAAGLGRGYTESWTTASRTAGLAFAARRLTRGRGRGRFGPPDAKRSEDTPGQDAAECLEGLPARHGTCQDASCIIDKIAALVLFHWSHNKRRVNSSLGVKTSRTIVPGQCKHDGKHYGKAKFPR